MAQEIDYLKNVLRAKQFFHWIWKIQQIKSFLNILITIPPLGVGGIILVVDAA